MKMVHNKGIHFWKILLPSIFLIISVTILFLPAMLGWKGIFHDDQLEEFPRYYFVAKNFQQGIIPLWNPHIWCGAIPFYARYYADTYYIPLWPFQFFANLNNLHNSYWMLILIPLWLHYIWAGLGMFYFLKKAIKCGIIPSIFGALAYVYSPTFTYAYVWQQVVSVQAWLPWLLLIYISAVNKLKLWKLLLGGIIFAFIITAAAPTLWPFVIFVWGGIIIMMIVSHFHRVFSFRVFLPFLIGMIIILVGTGLGGIYLCSFYDGISYTQEHIPLTVDYTLREEIGSLPPIFLSTLFIPNLFDNITGASMLSLNPSHNVLYWEANLSGGIVITFLVLLGMLLPFKISSFESQNPKELWYALMASLLYLFAILCILGRHTPFYRIIIGNLPFVGRLPRPIRYRFIQCFSAAILSAIGLDSCVKITPLQNKRYLRFSMWFYIIMVLFVVSISISWPFKSYKVSRYQWRSFPNCIDDLAIYIQKNIRGFYSLKNPVGNYAPEISIRKIGIYFGSKSKGEIWYADTPELITTGKGVFVSEYDVPEEGWYTFDVKIPPGKFVCIYSKLDSGEIGFVTNRGELKIEGFIYNPNEKKWEKRAGAIFINFYQEVSHRNTSLIYKFLSKDRYKKQIFLNLLYGILGLLILVLSIYRLTPRIFGYFMGLLAVFECFIFGMLAFYKGTYTFGEPTYYSIRTSGPFHPIFQHLKELSQLMGNGMMYRFATTQPYHDNFAQLIHKLAFMGYEMHPLERRFKQAIEVAYGEEMDYLIYEVETWPLPEYKIFLSNFSVKYLFSSQPLPGIFEKGEVLSLSDGSKFYFYINSKCLPRLYTMDKIIIASPQEQLKKLISEDLRKAVYVSFFDRVDGEIKDTEPLDNNIESRFVKLQEINKIENANFDNPNFIKLDINVKKPAMLVVTDIWYPGWKVYVDGKQKPLLRVNYCQRGVWLEKGEHRVEFKFLPKLWRLGMGITLMTMAIVLVLIFSSFIFFILKNISEKV